jgi:hypothetical protein
MQNDVEITPEMIETGIAAIRPLDANFYDMNTLEKLGQIVRAIYVAMELKRLDGQT